MYICKICNKEYNGKTSSQLCSDICRQKARKLNYLNRCLEKKCKRCGDKFYGTKQKRNCEKCSNSKRIVNFAKIEKSVMCPKCHEVTGFVEKYKTKDGGTFIFGKVCDNCKLKSKQKISERMKSELNPSIIKYGRKKEEKRSREEVLLFMSERMLGSKNPMKNPKTRAKVSQALKNKGDWMPKGVLHKNWKGNRDRCQTIRTRLYKPWVRPILERDKFTCCKCGKVGGRLEVHHIQPSFQSLVEIALDGRKIFELNEYDFEQLIIDVIERHKNVMGITYCVSCHRKVDPKRR